MCIGVESESWSGTFFLCVLKVSDEKRKNAIFTETSGGERNSNTRMES